MVRFPVSFFSVRCGQRTLATRKHELWECLGNSLMKHTHEGFRPPCSISAGTLGHFWDSDQVLFARGLLPHDWLPANELAECTEVRMWECSGFNECANSYLLVASDGSGGSRDIHQHLRQVAFGVATFLCANSQWHIFRAATHRFLGAARCQADRRFHVPSFQIFSRNDQHPNSD